MNQIFALLLILSTSLLATSCLSDDDMGSAEISVVVQLAWEGDTLANALGGRSVTLTNTSGRTYTATTTAKGLATFKVIPDVYSISTAWETASADEVGVIYNISGTANNLVISTPTMQTLGVTRSKKASLLVSKIYYAGCKDRNNRNYVAGRYLELYNNSADSINVAGLYIGLVESESAASGVVYPFGQTPDAIYLKQVFRIPTATAHWLAPGHALVIANSAIDHSANNTDGYERDLTTADYEAKQTNATNNPATPALDVIYTTFPSLTQMNLTQGGLTSVVLFNAPHDHTFTQVYKLGKTSGNRFIQLPTAWVTDAVEVLRYNPTAIDITEKRLYNHLDAGYTHITAVSGYSGQMVVRQVASTTATGRKILVDTNNSTNDFTLSTSLPLRTY